MSDPEPKQVGSELLLVLEGPGGGLVWRAWRPPSSGERLFADCFSLLCVLTGMPSALASDLTRLTDQPSSSMVFGEAPETMRRGLVVLRPSHRLMPIRTPGNDTSKLPCLTRRSGLLRGRERVQLR